MRKVDFVRLVQIDREEKKKLETSFVNPHKQVTGLERVAEMGYTTQKGPLGRGGLVGPGLFGGAPGGGTKSAKRLSQHIKKANATMDGVVTYPQQFMIGSTDNMLWQSRRFNLDQGRYFVPEQTDFVYTQNFLDYDADLIASSFETDSNSDGIADGWTISENGDGLVFYGLTDAFYGAYRGNHAQGIVFSGNSCTSGFTASLISEILTDIEFLAEKDVIFCYQARCWGSHMFRDFCSEAWTSARAEIYDGTDWHYGDWIVLSGNQWTSICLTTELPSDADNIRVRMTISGPTSFNLLDCAQLEEGTTSHNYKDGDVPIYGSGHYGNNQGIVIPQISQYTNSVYFTDLYCDSATKFPITIQSNQCIGVNYGTYSGNTYLSTFLYSSGYDTCGRVGLKIPMEEGWNRLEIYHYNPNEQLGTISIMSDFDTYISHWRAPLPAVPTNISAEALEKDSIKLTCIIPYDAEGVAIYASYNETKWYKEIGKVYTYGGSTEIEYIDTNIVGGQRKYYRFRAFNSSGLYSDFTQIVSAEARGYWHVILPSSQSFQVFLEDTKTNWGEKTDMISMSELTSNWTVTTVGNGLAEVDFDLLALYSADVLADEAYIIQTLGTQYWPVNVDNTVGWTIETSIRVPRCGTIAAPCVYLDNNAHYIFIRDDNNRGELIYLYPDGVELLLNGTSAAATLNDTRHTLRITGDTTNIYVYLDGCLLIGGTMQISAGIPTLHFGDDGPTGAGHTIYDYIYIDCTGKYAPDLEYTLIADPTNRSVGINVCPSAAAACTGLTVYEDIIPSVNLGGKIGWSSRYWGTAYINTIYTALIYGTASIYIYPTGNLFLLDPARNDEVRIQGWITGTGGLYGAMQIEDTDDEWEFTIPDNALNGFCFMFNENAGGQYFRVVDSDSDSQFDVQSDGTVNVCESGDLLSANANNVFNIRGSITGPLAKAGIHYIDDAQDDYVITITDDDLEGISILLPDYAGATEFRVVDSLFSASPISDHKLFSVESNGVIHPIGCPYKVGHDETGGQDISDPNPAVNGNITLDTELLANSDYYGLDSVDEEIDIDTKGVYWISFTLCYRIQDATGGTVGIECALLETNDTGSWVLINDLVGYSLHTEQAVASYPANVGQISASGIYVQDNDTRSIRLRAYQAHGTTHVHTLPVAASQYTTSISIMKIAQEPFV